MLDILNQVTKSHFAKTSPIINDVYRGMTPTSFSLLIDDNNSIFSFLGSFLS